MAEIAPAAPKRGFGWVLAPVLVFAALAAVFAFALKTGDPSKLPSALIGKPVPATAFPPLDGLVEGARPVPGFTSADLAKGKVTIVNFWASWCIPCVEEHPLLATLKSRAGVDLFGVSYKDSTANARQFIARYGNPFTALGVDSSGRAAIEWGVYGMPETFVVDGKGRIAYKQVGPITPKSIETQMLPAIEKAKAAQ